MKEIQKHYDYLVATGYEVMYLALQGSQNYGLEEYDNEYKSDIDTKAIVLPHFRDFVKNKKPVSHTIVLDNNEHIDVKDVRCMFDMFKKQNLSYLEVLYTDYYIAGEDWEAEIKSLREHRDEIAHVDKNKFLKSIAGQSQQKVTALCHPYPAVAALQFLDDLQYEVLEKEFKNELQLAKI